MSPFEVFFITTGQQPKAESRVLRSKEQFTYKDNCLFYGQQASQTDTSKRGIDVFPVRTEDFQVNIENICRERNDSWSTNVLSRIQFVQDLHAADAVYHQKCSVNFRTGKSLPSPTPNKKKTTGRPPKQGVQIAFQRIWWRHGLHLGTYEIKTSRLFW